MGAVQSAQLGLLFCTARPQMLGVCTKLLMHHTPRPQHCGPTSA